MEQNKIDKLICSTVKYFGGTPSFIQHFIKVHSFAALIGRMEKLSEQEQFILEATAVVHDVGIPPAMEKHGSSAGPYQEKEGGPVARKLLTELEFPADVIERVAYLVEHHHTYSDIDGLDYQILVEADFLVNLFEGNTPKENIEHTLKTIFRTQAGIGLLKDMFGVE